MGVVAMRVLTRLSIVLCLSAFALAARATNALAAVPETKPMTVAGPDGSTFTFTAGYRGRAEFADWFEAGPPLDNSGYVFMGNRFQLGATGKWKWLSGMLQYQHTLLVGVPDDGVGVGGIYRLNSDSTFQQGGWIRQGWLQAEVPSGDWKLTLQGGRFRYLDGSETLSKHPSLEWIRKNRIAERLIGPFDFTHVGRSFDGVRVAADRTAVNASGFYFVPTSGGFEVNAGHHMDIDLGGLSLMLKDGGLWPGTEARLFWIHYRDERPENGDVVVLDNRPLAVRQADDNEVAIETIGADLVGVKDVGDLTFDGMAWVAGQTGDWQSQDHSAWALALEAGVRFQQVAAKPWLRLGYFRSSGDDDAADGDHDTFFQLLPTSRLYAFTPFYNLMNNQDLMAQLITRPLAALGTRTDFHWLRVSEDEDLLYFGGGATKQEFFGYGGTPAGGASDTAYVIEQTVTYTVSRNLELQAYVGHAFGQGVVENGFPVDDELTYGFVEWTLTF
jgi:hypothetical protein